MLSVLLAGCNAPFAITVIMLSLGSNGAATITNLQNCQDLSPQFAGTLFGIANCIGSITGVLTPYLTSVFTKERVSTPFFNCWLLHNNLLCFRAVYQSGILFTELGVACI